MRKKSINREYVAVFLVVFTAFALRVIMFGFADRIGGDSVTRVYEAVGWSRDPHWIWYGVWGPLYNYLVGAVTVIFKEFYYSPIILNSLLASLGAIPFYYFVKREFSEQI